MPGRCFRPKTLGKDTLQHVELLQTVKCVPGSQLLWAVSHAGGGLADAAAFESSLLTSLTPVPIQLPGSQSWILVVSVLWSVLRSLSGMSRCWVLTHTPGKFCLLLASAHHHTLHSALLQCQLSQMLPHHPKGEWVPKESRVRQTTLLCKGRKNRLENHLNCVCLWQEIVSSMLHVSRSEIIKQHHSASITSGVRLNIFPLLHQMVTPTVI